MPIRDDREAQAGLTRVLLANYPRIATDQLDEIMRLLADQDTNAAMAALDRHILGESGRWPPVAGQILDHIRAAETTQQRQGAPPDRPRGQRQRVEIPPEVRGYFPPETTHIDVWPNDCKHCADSGKARFYHTTNGRLEVYLAPEALELPSALLGRLRISLAICDCQAGMARQKERNLMTTRFPSGDGGEMATWPVLETIRRMARKRRTRDLQAVGA